ncbi:penicillin-binding protein transpeptidase, partial [Bifidobacterium thermacidophilum subsp. thermacidophilum]
MCRLTARVGTLVGERIVRRVGLREDSAVGRENRPSRGTELVVQRTTITRIGIQFVRAECGEY